MDSDYLGNHDYFDMKTWCRGCRSLPRITIHTDIGYAGEAKNNSEIKIPNSSVVPPKTIFAFLMLNTMC